jgi:hypothetical protein
VRMYAQVCRCTYVKVCVCIYSFFASPHHGYAHAERATQTYLALGETEKAAEAASDLLAKLEMIQRETGHDTTTAANKVRHLRAHINQARNKLAEAAVGLLSPHRVSLLSSHVTPHLSGSASSPSCVCSSPLHFPLLSLTAPLCWLLVASVLASLSCFSRVG